MSKVNPDDVVLLLTNASDSTYRGLMWWCPGYEQIHACQVAGSEKGRAVWKWNGSTAKPTLEPSVRMRPYDGLPACHLFIRKGVAEFLPDCGHELAGEKVAMLPENADVFARMDERAS